MGLKGRFETFSGKGFSAKLPTIGRLAIGEKKQNASGVEYPASLDYFKLVTENKDVELAWREVYGEKPSEILVSFFSNEEEKVCNQKIEMRYGKVKFAWGDGRTFMYWNPKANGGKGGTDVIEVSTLEEQVDVMNKIQGIAKEMAKNEKGHKPRVGDWAQTLTMSLWLPEIRVPGEFRFITMGEHSSIKNITQSFDTIKAAAGTVVRFPFSLRVSMHHSDNMSRSKYPVLDLIPRLDQRDIVRMRELGDGLFDSVNTFREGMGVLSSESIERSVKELGEGDGAIVQKAPEIKQDIGEPTLEVLEKSNGDDAWKDVEGVEVVEGGVGDVVGVNPNDMTLAQAFKRLKIATSYHEAYDLYTGPFHRFQGNPRFRVAFLMRAVQVVDNLKLLDKLVEMAPDLKENEEFRSAQAKRRGELV